MPYYLIPGALLVLVVLAAVKVVVRRLQRKRMPPLYADWPAGGGAYGRAYLGTPVTPADYVPRDRLHNEDFEDPEAPE